MKILSESAPHASGIFRRFMNISSFSDGTDSHTVLANMLDYIPELRDGCPGRLERLRERLRAPGQMAVVVLGTMNVRRVRPSSGLIRFGVAHRWLCAVEMRGGAGRRGGLALA